MSTSAQRILGLCSAIAAIGCVVAAVHTTAGPNRVLLLAALAVWLAFGAAAGLVTRGRAITVRAFALGTVLFFSRSAYSDAERHRWVDAAASLLATGLAGYGVWRGRLGRPPVPPMDTIKHAMTTARLQRAVSGGLADVVLGGKRRTVRFAPSLHRQGRVRFPSGRIVACDPLVFPDEPALEDVLMAGELEVMACVAEYEDGDRRVGFLVMGNAGALPDSWRQVGSFGVDSGTAGFLDAEASGALTAFLDSGRGDELVGALREADLVSVPLDASSAANLAACHSGLGDGVYSVWAGYRSGRLECLVADFALDL